MMQLKPDECRVLGVLVEKALTTPAQYPLTLNSLTTGCNQKNNRFPVVNWDEDRVMDALDSLRQKGLVREAMLTSSRVAKFRHMAREVLHVDTPQLIILTELLLRGPQSIGDIRQNASRMHPLESLEITRNVLDSLMQRPEPDGTPMVKEIPPPPGQRARLFVQLLCPDLHPLNALMPSDSEPEESRAQAASPGLAARVEALESEVARLRAAIGKFAASLGEPDPLA
jgi:uncharacterized protein